MKHKQYKSKERVMRFGLRCSKEELANITKLAKKLGVKESEAVRVAVSKMLAG